MYRNNKANLWLRTICIAVALLGMLFFTHSQFSSAVAPQSISVSFTTNLRLPLDCSDGYSIWVVITPAGEETVNTAVTVTYNIGDTTRTETLGSISDSADGSYRFFKAQSVADGEVGVFEFTKVNFGTSSQAAADYTDSSSPPVVTMLNGLSADATADITNVTSVDVEISSSGDDTTVTNGESVNVDVVVGNAAEGVAVVADDAVTGDATDHTLQYKIGTGASTDLALFLGDNDTHFTGMLAVDSMTPEGAFTFESVKLSLQNGEGIALTAKVLTYTAEMSSHVVVSLTDGMLTIDYPNAVTDVSSVKVKISASGDDSTVIIGETVTVEVNVGKAAEGVPVVTTSTTGAATAHTLQYKIGESGSSTDLDLVRGDNDTHFTSMLTVGLGTTAGVFIFESVTLSLQNADGDALAAEVKTYTTETTSDVVVGLTDAVLTINPANAVTDITSVAVSITGSGDGTTVTLSETVDVDVIVVNADEGVAVVADNAHTLQYKIGASGDSTDLDLLRGDNDTHFRGMLAVDDMSTPDVFIFESVTLSLQNGAGNALTPKKITYTTADSTVLTLTYAAELTLDPTSGVLVLANVTAVNNTAGVGDTVTFTAWITNGTNDKPLNVTVNYKITGTKDVTGSVILTNQGPNETNSTVDIWNGTFTIPDNATAGNITIESIVVWLMNTDGNTSRTISAAGAKATNVVKIDIPAPVDPPTDNTTTNTTAATTASANASASSSESSSGLPVSIFAVFILIASVSMVAGVYTLRRRQ